MGQYFELLIPRAVPDARLTDPMPRGLSNAFARLPPMEPTARNVFLWNQGRHAVQQFGVYYLKRVEAFMGVYLMAMVGVTVYNIARRTILMRSTFLDRFLLFTDVHSRVLLLPFTMP